MNLNIIIIFILILIIILIMIMIYDKSKSKSKSKSKKEAFVGGSYAISKDRLKAMKFDNLQKRITSKHDNRTTKIKKMVIHHLNKVKNDINRTGEFLNIVNMNNKDANGCILFRPMAADLTEQIIEDEIAGGVTVKTEIQKSINTFVNDYEYLLYTYYNIDKRSVYSTELPTPNTKGIVNRFSVKEYYLKDLKDILESVYPKFDNSELVLYDAQLIKNTLIKTLDNFNFKDLPTSLTSMLQELDMKQCTTNKKCCA